MPDKIATNCFGVPMQQSPFYIFGEDLAYGLIGPFDTYADACMHIVFKRYRGDADVNAHDNARIVGQTDPLYLAVINAGNGNPMIIAPDDDKFCFSPHKK